MFADFPLPQYSLPWGKAFGSQSLNIASAVDPDKAVSRVVGQSHNHIGMPETEGFPQRSSSQYQSNIGLEDIRNSAERPDSIVVPKEPFISFLRTIYSEREALLRQAIGKSSSRARDNAPLSYPDSLQHPQLLPNATIRVPAPHGPRDTHRAQLYDNHLPNVPFDFVTVGATAQAMVAPPFQSSLSPGIPTHVAPHAGLYDDSYRHVATPIEQRATVPYHRTLPRASDGQSRRRRRHGSSGCDRSYSTAAATTTAAHVEANHALRLPADSEAQERLRCSWKGCGKEVYDLRKHVDTVHLHKHSVLCPRCNTVFSRRDSLKRHLPCNVKARQMARPY